jgi:hypothetical protein
MKNAAVKTAMLKKTGCKRKWKFSRQENKQPR